MRSLTTIMTTRFLCDLQAANRRDMKLDSDDPLHLSRGSSGSLSFVRVMGSIGATISGGAVDEDVDQISEVDNDVADLEQVDGGSGEIHEEVVQA